MSDTEGSKLFLRDLSLTRARSAAERVAREIVGRHIGTPDSLPQVVTEVADKIEQAILEDRHRDDPGFTEFDMPIHPGRGTWK